jgi:hypothetical protein
MNAEEARHLALNCNSRTTIVNYHRGQIELAIIRAAKDGLQRVNYDPGAELNAQVWASLASGLRADGFSVDTFPGLTHLYISIDWEEVRKPK